MLFYLAVGICLMSVSVITGQPFSLSAQLLVAATVARGTVSRFPGSISQDEGRYAIMAFMLAVPPNSFAIHRIAEVGERLLHRV